MVMHHPTISNGNALAACVSVPPPRVMVPTDYDAIPDELKQRPQWVLWKFVKRNGKWTKIPFSVNTRREASTTDPSTWSTFAEGVHALGEGSAFAGIGYVFTDDDPYTGVDLDDCIVDGAIVTEAMEIVESFATYTERSPSGNGIKLITKASKPSCARCRSKRINGFKETEIYDKERFFTITGDRLPGTPAEITDGQKALESLCNRLWPQQPDTNTNNREPQPVDVDDEKLLTLMFRSKHGDTIRALWDGDLSGHGDDHSAADLALCNHLAFWCAKDPGRMDRLFRGSGLYRDKWDRDNYRQWTLDMAIEDCTQVFGSKPKHTKQPLHSSNESKPMDGTTLPKVFLGTDEWRAIAETIDALSRDADLYQRGNVLVRVLRETHSNDGVIRPEGSATIVQVPPANLRERMTKCADFEAANKKGEILPTRPAPWLVAGVDARGDWPGIRHLMGVSDAPILRADGSVCQTPGYDAKTGVLFDPPPGATFPRISEGVNIDDASAALDHLLEVVADFRFESDEHRAAWLAGLLTPLARFAFRGSSPLFLIDANVRGAGKGLLTQTIGQIVMGREMPVSSYAHDSEEMRKKITSLAIAGDRLVLLDNLEGSFGNDALDRALTSTRWKDRILGKSEQVDLPLLPVWYGTGNNVQVGADTIRRILHIRLDVLEERPEDRCDFRHPDLIGWIKQHRGRLLTAALTILSAYIRSGKPKQNVTPFGSFEDWSRLVREAVVWVGMPDPCRTRERLAELADTGSDMLEQILDTCQAVDPFDQGIYLGPLCNRLYPQETQYQPNDEASAAMRTLLEDLTGGQPGRKPSAKVVAARFTHHQGRVCRGRRLEMGTKKTKHGKPWFVRKVCTPTAGDLGDLDDSVSAPFARETP